MVLGVFPKGPLRTIPPFGLCATVFDFYSDVDLLILQPLEVKVNLKGDVTPEDGVWRGHLLSVP